MPTNYNQLISYIIPYITDNLINKIIIFNYSDFNTWTFFEIKICKSKNKFNIISRL